MAFLGDEPKHELIIERVPGGRRAALTVGVVAVLVVGTLVWKPWDVAAPAATPGASFPLVAVATPITEQSPPPTSPPASTPVTPPAPIPDIAEGPDLSFPSQSGLGTVAFTTGDGPNVHCLYRSKAQATPTSLTSMIVDSPLVFPSPGSSAAKARWRVAIESNTQDKIFEAEWQPVSRTKAAQAVLTGMAPAVFEPMFVKVPRADPITIYRVTIEVDWLDHHGNVLEVQQIHPTVYGPMGNANAPLGPGGCVAASS